MDELTLAAYDTDPKKYCRDWLGQPPPAEIHTSVLHYFRPEGATADIGSGCGRDVDWLSRHGWPCIGYEPSAGLRTEAMRLYPACEFLAESLPSLAGISDNRFDNVLCETVLMHLPSGEQLAALDSLLRILRQAGVMRLSWRAGKDGNTRDPAGRLYEPVDGTAVKARFAQAGASLLDEGAACGASGAIIRYVVICK